MNIILIILNVFIILITLYLSFLFIKSKSFNTIPCYNMIIFSLILCVDNILRIIPLADENQEKKDFGFIAKAEAFLLVWFDKLILATLSMQAVIFFLGVVKTNFYYAHEKAIFTITFTISLVITSILSGIYIFAFGLTIYGNYYYCDDPEGNIKKYIDTVFNSIYVLINIVCLADTLCYIWNKRKEQTFEDIQDFDFKRFLRRTIIMFILNNWAFCLSYLIIYDQIDIPIEQSIDIIYLTTCFAITLFNAINRTVWKETQVIFCNKTFDEKKDYQLKAIRTYDEDDEDSSVRSESF